jgi:crotonobetainyl-CoA:carnitine CoA-transferase CaiB-like acyl-CoA transferase
MYVDDVIKPGEPGQPPVRYGIPIGDLGGAVFAVIGILSALVSRSITGEGRMKVV